MNFVVGFRDFIQWKFRFLASCKICIDCFCSAISFIKIGYFSCRNSDIFDYIALGAISSVFFSKLLFLSTLLPHFLHEKGASATASQAGWRP
tara:strand:- start:21 stop:296 length:276 start_codon:yes stop_codon:yes gene_type:complete